MSNLKSKAERYLRAAVAATHANFRAGQWEAIRSLIEDRSRMLVVQRTGWGKSMVYFLATRLLRDGGAGPTLLVSPLLALMRNQIEAAERIGIRAVTINSVNVDEWMEIEQRLTRNEIDILLISPERLSNDRFRENVLVHIAGRVGLFVVDEAHCISDWGHDFRPDYRRIVRILQALPLNIPVLATTATANDRVVRDVVEQIGPDLKVIRGPLGRDSLRLQAIEMPSQAERMAWLAEQLPAIAGSGIIYVRTIRDAERVAAWLKHCGLAVYPYHGQQKTELREDLEQKLLTNDVKALVATSALGMGFDKSDLTFVIHFQRPGSVVEYYQQVGRAGRNGEAALGILLSGAEDDDITDYFIKTAFPPAEHVESILRALEESEQGLSLAELENAVNLSRGQILKVLKNLDVLSPSPISKQGSRYFRTANEYTPDLERIAKLTAIRQNEQTELREYMEGDMCHMAYLRMKLDDDNVDACGRCAVDVGRPFLTTAVNEKLVQQAVRYLKRSYRPIRARKQKPDRSVIQELRLAEDGFALCVYGDAGWGDLVRRGKYEVGRFDDALVEAAAEMVKEHWRPDPPPSWICCVPSMRHPELVPSFAERLACRLDLPFVHAVVKVRDTPQQKEMHNSHHQIENLRAAFAVDIPERFRGHHVFLVDDMVDSRWTFTFLAALLRQHGAGRVYPLALAETTSD